MAEAPPKASAPNTIALKGRISTSEFEENISIQAVTPTQPAKGDGISPDIDGIPHFVKAKKKWRRTG